MTTGLKVCAHRALTDFTYQFDLTIATSGITAICGASGAGKTSLLRLIAGLDNVAQAQVNFAQQIWQNEGHFLSASSRNVGYVFQQPCLFEHLTVNENLNFAIKRASIKRIDVEDKSDLIELLHISHLLHRYPQQLSGGETQRVAIAQALLKQPQLLLMDEPLSALDVEHKQHILRCLKQLKKRFAIPILYVSHQIDEIMQLADEVIILDKGQVCAQGKAELVLTQHDLLGRLTSEPSTMLFGQYPSVCESVGFIEVKVGSQSLKLVSDTLPDESFSEQNDIRMLIKAKDISITLSLARDSSILNILPCEIVAITLKNQQQVVIKLQWQNHQLLAKISHYSCQQLDLKVGQSVYAQIKAIAIIN